MRAVRYHEHGGTDVLTVENVSQPEPGPNTIRVSVEAIGVNPIDALFREGILEPPELPMVPGSDFAGIVDATGEGVTDISVGDKVFGTGMDSDPRGTYAEHIVVPTDKCCRLPENVPFDVGAAVAHVGVTAWRALFDHASLVPGDTCLIHGGSGGVGHVAVQLAVTGGASVIATAGSAKAREHVRQLGAEHVFDYTHESLGEQIQRTASDGVDIVLDHMIDQYLQLDIDVAAFDADVVALGGQRASLDDAQTARNKDVVVHHVSMFNTREIAEVLDHLRELLAKSKLTADVAKTYSLRDAALAQRDLAERSFLGKVVIRP